MWKRTLAQRAIAATAAGEIHMNTFIDSTRKWAKTSLACLQPLIKQYISPAYSVLDPHWIFSLPLYASSGSVRAPHRCRLLEWQKTVILLLNFRFLLFTSNLIWILNKCTAGLTGGRMPSLRIKLLASHDIFNVF